MSGTAQPSLSDAIRSSAEVFYLLEAKCVDGDCGILKEESTENKHQRRPSPLSALSICHHPGGDDSTPNQLKLPQCFSLPRKDHVLSSDAYRNLKQKQMSEIKEKGYLCVGLVRILCLLEGTRRKISHLPPETCGMHLSAQDRRLLQLTGCFSSR